MTDGKNEVFGCGEREGVARGQWAVGSGEKGVGERMAMRLRRPKTLHAMLWASRVIHGIKHADTSAQHAVPHLQYLPVKQMQF